jgi:hypothetical protein
MSLAIYNFFNILTVLLLSLGAEGRIFAREEIDDVVIEEMSIDNLDCYAVRKLNVESPAYEIRCKMTTKSFLKLCVSLWPAQDSNENGVSPDPFLMSFEKTVLGMSTQSSSIPPLQKFARNVQSRHQFVRYSVAMMQRFCLE